MASRGTRRRRDDRPCCRPSLRPATLRTQSPFELAAFLAAQRYRRRPLQRAEQLLAAARIGWWPRSPLSWLPSSCRIGQLGAEIRDRFLTLPEAPITLSLPRMSHRTGPRFLTEVGTLARFTSPDALENYAGGLTPTLWQSGGSSAALPVSALQPAPAPGAVVVGLSAASRRRPRDASTCASARRASRTLRRPLLGVEMDEAAGCGALVAMTGRRSPLAAGSPRRQVARCTVERASPSTAAMRSGPQPVVSSGADTASCGKFSRKRAAPWSGWSRRADCRAACQRGSQR